MNTLSTHLSNTTAKADKLVAPFAALYSQRAKVRLWAFSAAVRLSDQDKPIALKLLVELAIVIRILTLLAQHARCVTGKTVVAYRAPRPMARAGARRVKSCQRSVRACIRQCEVTSTQRVVSEEVHGRPVPVFQHLLRDRTLSRTYSIETRHTIRHMQCLPQGACSNPGYRRSTRRGLAPQEHALLRRQLNVQFAPPPSCML